MGSAQKERAFQNPGVWGRAQARGLPLASKRPVVISWSAQGLTCTLRWFLVHRRTA